MDERELEAHLSNDGFQEIDPQDLGSLPGKVFTIPSLVPDNISEWAIEAPEVSDLAQPQQTDAHVGAALKETSDPVPDRKSVQVNKINWAQVGRVTEPGRYMFKFGWLTISPDDLLVWQLNPTVHFTLFETVRSTETHEPNAAGEFRLGTFELIDNLSASEK